MVGNPPAHDVANPSGVQATAPVLVVKGEKPRSLMDNILKGGNKK